MSRKSAASCDSGVRKSTCARHAVVLRQAGEVGICCHVLYFLIVVCIYTMRYKDELGEKLVDWKCLSRFWKIPLCSSHRPSNLFLSNWSSVHLFFYWKCPLHPHTYSKQVNFNHPLLQAIWYLWFPPSSLFNNHPSLQTNICVSQESFHVATHHAHSSVIAWF